VPSVSVSNLELFRMWRADEDLDLNWLLRRLRGEEPQTEAMLAGIALHKALEKTEGESMILEADGYKFHARIDLDIEVSPFKELRIEKQYGDLTVRGRVDDLNGLTVTDYKSTGNFDADRMLEGFQWRLYLDMTECDTFVWKVFVMKDIFFHEYDIYQYHELKQKRYPALGQECARLASDFMDFARELERANTSWAKTAVLEA
jgi:PD-(D/E)XK nuclease superfamily